MGIVSLKFFIFLSSSFGIYYLLPDKYKKISLIISSLLFYLSYGIPGTCIAFLFVLSTYYFGLIAKQKALLFFSLLFTLIPLLLNKYFVTDFPFFVHNSIKSIPIIGISFLTFKAISYIVESYRQKDFKIAFSSYLLYMLFFPTCLSGPIEEPILFIKNESSKERLSWENFIGSLLMIMYGMAIKLIFADRIIPIIDAIYFSYEKYTKYCILAILSYSFYIYADFAGYSYMAKGISGLFGYCLTENFKQPYFSTSIKEFWNRWHISLNNWLRTYVYIPLGGNKKGRIKKNFNILIVFLISGIWHGAGWGFIIWGLMNGFFQVIGDITFSIRNRINIALGLDHFFLTKQIKMLAVFLLISFTWIFFYLLQLVFLKINIFVL